FGPQIELEGPAKDRFWNGAVYGQSCGGYWYQLWLEKHEKARQAFKKDDWNRVTVEARGKVIKTWLNGVPAAHWVGDGTYSNGFFGLQVHSGKKGTILFRRLKVKEFKGAK
ncbi:MAG: family 16 glycoside hydrolase, partial [Akkermansiaceae bacterium]